MNDDRIPSTKEDFFQSLEEIVTDPMFITDQTDLLKKEIEANQWGINLPVEIALLCTNQDIENFIDRVVRNRIEQLEGDSQTKILIFYVWNDPQSFQLKFNVINSNHPRLPFKQEVKPTSLREIVEDFLKGQHQNLPWPKTTEAPGPFTFKNTVRENIKVFSMVLSKAQ